MFKCKGVLGIPKDNKGRIFYSSTRNPFPDDAQESKGEFAVGKYPNIMKWKGASGGGP